MPEERRDISLRISVTDRCELRCLYCKASEGLPLVPRAQVLRYEQIIDFVRVLGYSFRLSKVRITGGEPLFRRDILRFVDMLAREDVPDVALTTNAQRLRETAAGLAAAGLRRVNVSLDSLDEDTYRKLTRGGELGRALAGIEAARCAGLEPIKLNMVVLRGINDGEVADIARFGIERGLVVRFLELMPIGVASALHREWFVPSAEVRQKLASSFDLEPLVGEPGSSSRDFRVRDGCGRTGVVGLISPCTRPFCDRCRRLRLTATGRLLGCLAQAEGIDIRPMLAASSSQARAQVVEAVERALLLKHSGRRFGDQKHMVRIGG